MIIHYYNAPILLIRSQVGSLIICDASCCRDVPGRSYFQKLEILSMINGVEGVYVE